jgi:hypothetical protein
MKKSKKVELKNPHLIGIRNNLRKLIWAAYRERTHKIHEIYMKLLKEQPITSEEKEFYDKNATERKNLDSVMNNSIIICPLCGQIDKDMVFQPYRRRWLCVEDFEDLMEKYDRKKKSKLRTILANPKIESLHIDLLEDILDYDKETLKELSRKWGAEVFEGEDGTRVKIPGEKMETFLKHLDELVFPW